MSNPTHKMSFIEALTTPAQQLLQHVKVAPPQRIPHWTEYLREQRDDEN